MTMTEQEAEYPAALGVDGWTIADSDAAKAEGWGIFDCDGNDHGRFQLCCYDDPDIQVAFSSDDNAWQHVVDKAREGGALHLKALDFIKTHNPAEAALIKHATGWRS
jgi:hypothetical protein